MPDPESNNEPTPLSPLAEVSEDVVKAISTSRVEAASGQPAPGFRLLRELGRDAEPRLAEPRAVAVRGDGWIFALDRPAQNQFRLTGFPPAGQSGGFDVRFQKGPGDENLLDPVGLAIDRQQNVYVADAAANNVKRFSPDGRWLATFASAGFDGTAFSGPRDVAVDPHGNLYVADTYNNRVVKLTADGELAWVLERFPATDGGDDEFYEPYSVTAGGGNVLVADTNNNRLLFFDDKPSLRNALAKSGHFVFPSGVRLGPNGGNVYVADHGNQRVRRIADSATAAITLAARLDSSAAVAGGSAMDVTADGHIVLVHPTRGSIVVLDFPNG